MSKNQIILGLVIVFISGFVAFNGRPAVKSNVTNTGTTSTYNKNTITPVTSVKTTPVTTTTTTPKTTTSSTATSSGGYTMADVAKHASSSSCWTAVDGGVYDVTSFINQHPGGSGAIMSLCGRDGSAAFNNQHGGQRRPANELAGLQIGNLK